MTTIVPQQLEGSQSPNTLEILWEKHRLKISAAVWILVLALGIYYGLQYYDQSKTNKKWSAFASSVLLERGYAQQDTDIRAIDIDTALLKDLEKASLQEIESKLA